MKKEEGGLRQNLGGSTSLANKPKSSAPVVSSFFCWAGITEGQIHIESMDDHWGGRNERHVPALFLTRKEARKQFQDVRRVQICVLARNRGEA